MTPIGPEPSDLKTKEENTPSPELEELLRYLKEERGFDFTGYKRASLTRRIEKRMQAVQVTGYGAYQDYLEVHPGEFALLFNTILINVTAFFRDPLAWDLIRAEIVPQILSRKEAGAPLRLWSAGCASGAEPYTLALVLAEALGMEAFRERVKIYATDMDEEALAQARQASYSAREVASVPPLLLERYFEPSGSRFIVHKDLRRAVIFGRHDLLRDAPISHIDFLACRNTLMYFNSEMQAHALKRFYFSLEDDGFLFLGKAEAIFSHSDMFTPLDLKRRLFSKAGTDFSRERLLLEATAQSAATPDGFNSVRVREMVFEGGPVAQIVVGKDGLLALANERAQQMFGLSVRDIGRVFQDLEVSYRPLELRSCIEAAYREQRSLEVKDVPWNDSGSLNVRVVPLASSPAYFLGVSITFTDVSPYKRLQEELEESSRALETAYEELQSTNEELETTNEELQSTNEELETTNEELQSTNEELETMNEELQSTNEELQTMNEELQTRSGELGSVNAFMSSILASLRGGVIVVDSDLQITIWNAQSTDLWGVRAEEVKGKNLLNLDIGLPTEELKPALRATLSGTETFQEITLGATNRRGRTIECRITLTPLVGPSDEIAGVILVVREV